MWTLLSNPTALPFWQRETRKTFQQERKPFWEITQLNSEENHQYYARLLITISETLSNWKKKSIEVGLREQYKRFIQTEFFCNAPETVQETIYSFFEFHFAFSSNQYCKTQFKNEDEDEEEEEEGEEDNITEEVIQSRENLVLKTCNALHELHLLQLCEPIISQVCNNQIKILVNKYCRFNNSKKIINLK